MQYFKHIIDSMIDFFFLVNIYKTDKINRLRGTYIVSRTIKIKILKKNGGANKAQMSMLNSAISIEEAEYSKLHHCS